MLPEAFLDRMKAQLGQEYEAFLESYQRPRAVALRFNPLKGDAPALPFAQAPVPWEPMGYYYTPDARPGLHPYHEAGVYYLQEASAMAPVITSMRNTRRAAVSFFMGISPFSSSARNRATKGIIQHKETLDTSRNIKFREKIVGSIQKALLSRVKAFLS